MCTLFNPYEELTRSSQKHQDPGTNKIMAGAQDRTNGLLISARAQMVQNSGAHEDFKK
jgi:hypothetical protein